jgi:hypothetical protein
MDERQSAPRAAQNTKLESRRDFLRRLGLSCLGLVSLTATPQEVMLQAHQLRRCSKDARHFAFCVFGVKPIRSPDACEP